MRPKPNPTACIRLFCFPFGGGGASFYRTWTDGLPADVELCAIQLPGRETRLRERPFNKLLPLIQVLVKTLVPYFDRPFVFFGHSVGALISFELTRQLRRQNISCPFHLFVSGRRAPQIPSPTPPTHNLPDPEFIKELHRLNGTPEAVIRCEELMEMFLPVLRADFSMNETYAYKAADPLGCPITAFGGLDDPKARRNELVAWRDQTQAGFKLQLFFGDHFFIKPNLKLLLKIVSEDMMRTFKNAL
jgi:medium-chain acyl-[acyl-carrier-protein] hydrolase